MPASPEGEAFLTKEVVAERLCVTPRRVERWAHRTLEALCRVYWLPINVDGRRQGYGPNDAQDLTQEFFTQLIAKTHPQPADQKKGKFRTFAPATLDYFLAREWSRAHRKKRGGEFIFDSLERTSPEEQYRLEPPEGDSPDQQLAEPDEFRLSDHRAGIFDGVGVGVLRIIECFIDLHDGLCIDNPWGIF